MRAGHDGAGHRKRRREGVTLARIDHVHVQAGVGQARRDPMFEIAVLRLELRQRVADFEDDERFHG